MTSFGGYLAHLATRLLAPAKHLKATYEAFRQLLEWDQRSHEKMAELESFRHDEKKADFWAIRKTYEDLHGAVAEMVVRLDLMAPRSYQALFPRLRQIDAAVHASGLKLQPPDASPPSFSPWRKSPLRPRASPGARRPIWRRSLQHLICRFPGVSSSPPGPSTLFVKPIVSALRSRRPWQPSIRIRRAP
jgi:hypothetical protein